MRGKAIAALQQMQTGGSLRPFADAFTSVRRQLIFGLNCLNCLNCSAGDFCLKPGFCDGPSPLGLGGFVGRCGLSSYFGFFGLITISGISNLIFLHFGGVPKVPGGHFLG